MKQIDFIRRLKIFIAYAFEFSPVPVTLVTDLIKYIRFCTEGHPDLVRKFQRLEGGMIKSVDMLLARNPDIAQMHDRMNDSEEKRRLKLLFIINWKFGQCPPSFTDLLLKASSRVDKEDPEMGEIILQLERLFVHMYEHHTFGLQVHKNDGIPEVSSDLKPYDRRLREYYNAHCKIRN